MPERHGERQEAERGRKRGVSAVLLPLLFFKTGLAHLQLSESITVWLLARQLIYRRVELRKNQCGLTIGHAKYCDLLVTLLWDFSLVS